jgi:hypothetical protein
METEAGRFFEVSKVRISADGHVSDVLWTEVQAGSDRALGVPVLATAADVVDAIHDGARVTAAFPAEHRLPEREFLVVEHEDGRECITFGGLPSQGRELANICALDD